MNKVMMFAVALGLVVGFGACKPKQSAYKAAYEKAQQKPVEEVAPEPAPAPAPAPAPTSVSRTSDAKTTRENVRVISSSDNSPLRNFSVVIGSFTNKTNAENLKSRMEKDGFVVYLVQNEREMYRVIVATFDEKADAADKRDAIKAKYAPNFQDAWLLEKH